MVGFEGLLSSLNNSEEFMARFKAQAFANKSSSPESTEELPLTAESNVIRKIEEEKTHPKNPANEVEKDDKKLEKEKLQAEIEEEKAAAAEAKREAELQKLFTSSDSVRELKDLLDNDNKDKVDQAHKNILMKNNWSEKDAEQYLNAMNESDPEKRNSELARIFENATKGKTDKEKEQMLKGVTEITEGSQNLTKDIKSINEMVASGEITAEKGKEMTDATVEKYIQATIGNDQSKVMDFKEQLAEKVKKDLAVDMDVNDTVRINKKDVVNEKGEKETVINISFKTKDGEEAVLKLNENALDSKDGRLTLNNESLIKNAKELQIGLDDPVTYEKERKKLEVLGEAKGFTSMSGGEHYANGSNVNNRVDAINVSTNDKSTYRA